MTDLFTPEQLAAAREAWKLSVLGRCECVCGAVSASIVDTEDRFGLPLETVLCKACGTVRSKQVVAQRHLARFYRELYPVCHPGLERDRAEREQRQAAWLGDRYGLGGRVIEVGGRCLAEATCGAYHMLDVAVDSEPPSDRADLLVALHVLEHCTDPVATLREWASYVDDGGTMVVVVPNLLEVHHHRYVKAMGLRGWWQLAHAWQWSPQNVTLPFVKAGLSVMQWCKAAPGTLATVGSLVVTARKTDELAKYLEAHGA